jgi:hypothetical protein
MPIAPLLQRFVDDELARSAPLIEQTLSGTLRTLGEPRFIGNLTAAERAQLGPLIEALRRHAGPYVGAFIETLRDEVYDAVREQTSDALAAGATAGPGGLQLMDESEVEVDIEMSRAMRTIDDVAEWELRELQTFTSTLIGQTHVSPESNPFRPITFATALWRASCAVTPVQVQRALLLRASSDVIAGLLKTAWAAACSRLESQGVEPGIYRTVMLAPGSTPGKFRAGPADTTRAANLNSLLASLPPPALAPRRGADLAFPEVPTVSGPDFEDALLRLDELLRQLPAQASPDRDAAAALRKRLADQRRAVVASAGSVDTQVVELLSRLFETALSDEQLPAPFRAVLARLQVAALRVGLQDSSALDNLHHPVWQLIDRIGETASAYPQPGDPRLTALLAVCGVLAEDLARSPAPDAGLFRRSLARLDIFLAEQLHQEIQGAQAATETLLRSERRDTLEEQFAQRLANELRNKPAGPAVRRFVTGAWAKVLAETTLRHGEHGDATRAVLKAAEDLIWSLQPPDHAQSRQRLVTLLPGLLQRLRAGMALVELPAAEQQAVFDELMHLHTDALRAGPRGAAAASPEEIVRRMREEGDTPSAGDRRFADSLIDVPSLETVPAELLDTLPAARGHAVVETMAAGRRYRLFLHGRWQRTQLLWRSPQGQLLLFAGETPGRTHSATRRALERLEEAGLVKPLADPGLVQRSIDSLRRQLAAPA